MARVSHFIEEFKISFSPASPGLNTTAREAVSKSKPETKSRDPSSCIHKLAEKTKKSISTPLKAARRLGLYYKDHINQLVATNIPSAHSGYASRSISSYGDEMASEAELIRQAERNLLDKVFYIGPNNSPITPITTRASTISITPTEEGESPDTEGRCPNVSTIWAEAYAVSGNDSGIERIEKNMSDHLYFLGWDYEPEKKIVNDITVLGLKSPRKYHH